MMNNMPNFISVAHLTYYLIGGAGYATTRLHNALQNHNINSTIYTSAIQDYEYTKQIISTQQDIHFFHQTEITRQLIQLNQISAHENIYPKHTLVSYPFYDSNFSFINEVISKHDVINLHWIDGLLSLEQIGYISHQDKPVIWTVHDKSPFSGGCHCFEGCNNWKKDCINCPQLKDTLDNLPSKVLQAKKDLFNFDNITLVVLNQQFKEYAQQSPLYNQCRIEVIPNSIDVNTYIPLDKNTITHLKKEYHIPQNKKVLLFILSYKSVIKGYNELQETLSYLDKKEEYHLIIIGDARKEENILDKFTTTFTGHINQTEIIKYYNIADLTIVPSIEDNLPNICLESIACGTPIVGFKVGGIPDMAQENYTGTSEYP